MASGLQIRISPDCEVIITKSFDGEYIWQADYFREGRLVKGSARTLADAKRQVELNTGKKLDLDVNITI